MSLSSKGSLNSLNDDAANDLSRQNSILSKSASSGKRQRADSGILLQTITTENPSNTPKPESEISNTDDEQVVVLHYMDNRVRQGRLLLVTNIFRLLVVFILAFIIYFQV